MQVNRSIRVNFTQDTAANHKNNFQSVPALMSCRKTFKITKSIKNLVQTASALTYNEVIFAYSRNLNKVQCHMAPHSI